MSRKENMPAEVPAEIVEKAENRPVDAPNVPAPINIPTDTINQGTVAIEASRAIAEAQGKLLIAKRFPRDEVAAYAKAIQACQRPTMAAKAFYAYPRAGQTV